MSIKVTYYKQNLDPNSSVVGFLGLYIESMDLYLSKLRYIRNKNGGFFVAPPSEKYTDKEGKQCFQNYFWFGKKMADGFQKAASKAIDAHIKESSQAQQIPSDPLVQNEEEIPF